MDNHSALSLVSMEGVRNVPDENLSAGSELTELCVDEH